MDQKIQWCFEMLPGMQKQYQMIAREHMRHEECWMSSVQGEETSREMTDFCENEDGAKVGPKIWGQWLALPGHFESRVWRRQSKRRQRKRRSRKQTDAEDDAV